MPNPLIGVMTIAVGGYLLNSALVARPPLRTVRAILAEPSRARELLSEGEGTWVADPSAYPSTLPSNPGDKGESGFAQKPTGENGRLKNNQLRSLSWAPQHRLTPAAADALERLNKAYKARFGKNLYVSDSYRTYARQVALKAAKGKFAATPGTSNHGWGLAVDLGGGVNRFGTPEHEWMLANAPSYGWTHPSWAKQGQATPEPWHWEFTGGSSGGGSGGGTGGSW